MATQMLRIANCFAFGRTLTNSSCTATRQSEDRQEFQKTFLDINVLIFDRNHKVKFQGQWIVLVPPFACETDRKSQMLSESHAPNTAKITIADQILDSLDVALSFC